MPIRFDQPIWLALLLLLVPAILIAWRSRGGLSRAKVWTTLTLRTVLIATLALALAQPSWVRRGEGLTVTVLIDRSQSVPMALKTSALDFLTKAVEAKERREDRVAVVTIARDASITAMPDSYSAITVGADDGDPSATNLAAAVRLALAIMPNDTANRIVLASDGNETTDSVLAAAEIARANGVPIDVLPLEYEYPNEVLFERVVTPARAREGQTARVRMVLRSQTRTRGTVRLSMNGEPLDLNGAEPGDGLAVELDPGPNALEQMISL
ncbi:MAG: VWA domain-containing protein, partial [Phycisphaerae bacterium]|nr:VWA domain-containing protein [Phycisphaerae bacterium]